MPSSHQPSPTTITVSKPWKSRPPSSTPNPPNPHHLTSSQFQLTQTMLSHPPLPISTPPPLKDPDPKLLKPPRTQSHRKSQIRDSNHIQPPAVHRRHNKRRPCSANPASESPQITSASNQSKHQLITKTTMNPSPPIRPVEPKPCFHLNSPYPQSPKPARK
ncbi:hypothetical protein M0R45_019717 [Rubus argutus]|uniref:Extensin-like n=1 Tax=Rubus argutus TaxID=59490 RepID=A0AAW1X6N7_RUBAR